ncbi:MAG: Rrf2 family transcriptional regulator [Candidatus Marinimicrobia bacterium]|nr:Rrf2 family transcriptional regulator [Candidatus Neomarinimicrobiota bacterium]
MSSLVNISEGSSLALHGIAIVAIKNPERVNVKYLAKILVASEAHLAKIFQRLVKAGFIHSVRGPAGGFVLAKAAEDITLLDIYEAIEGKVNLQYCPLGKDRCQFSHCIFGTRLNEISQQIYNDLKSIKLLNFMKSITLNEEL